MSCAIEDSERLKQELIKAHKSKAGLENEKAEQDFITYAQTLPHYGGHFYTATWVSAHFFLTICFFLPIELHLD